jgi:hypothetical protein
MGLAASLAMTAFARWAALGAGGPWDWGAVRGWSWLASGVSAVVLVLFDHRPSRDRHHADR